ncbi:MAG: ADP compounds hydrolase NudE [Pseudomonadota bacterium]
MKQKPTIQAIRQLAKTRLFNIEEIDLVFSNGQTACYERIKGSSTGGGVLIIPVIDNKFMLVREYCAGVDRYEWMFPKGKIENDEPPLDAANRELQEEIGYAAKKLRYLKAMSLAPGYIGHSTHLVLATDLYPSQLEGDEPEPLIVESFSLTEIDQLVWREDITEGRTIAAMYLLKSLWEKGEL